MRCSKCAFEQNGHILPIAKSHRTNQNTNGQSTNLAIIQEEEHHREMTLPGRLHSHQHRHNRPVCESIPRLWSKSASSWQDSRRQSC